MENDQCVIDGHEEINNNVGDNRPLYNLQSQRFVFV